MRDRDLNTSDHACFTEEEWELLDFIY